LLMTGRGFGKTRAGAQWVIEQAKTRGTHIAMVCRVPADGRDVMVNGDSGVLASSSPDFRPTYIPSQRLLKWPNGSEARIFSSETPDDLRGPNFHCAWVDELAKYHLAEEAWDTLVMAVRLPPNPCIVVTTTPRPIPILKRLMHDPATVVTQGSIYDNRTNLSEKFFERLIKRYEGTYLGQQELEGLMVTDRPGALWTRTTCEQCDSLCAGASESGEAYESRTDCCPLYARSRQACRDARRLRRSNGKLGGGRNFPR
jgi:phage terminase large subunit-like protein